jgi:hypothetical protein
LAQRQDAAVDPDNRVVAAELEHRWELALQGLMEAQEAAARVAAQPPAPTLDLEVRRQLSDLGPQLPALWSSGRLSSAHKKALRRSRIRRGIVTRPRPDAVDLVIVWISGASTRLTVRTTASQPRAVTQYADLVARIEDVAAAGYPDRSIAEQRTQEGFHSARQGGRDPARPGHPPASVSPLPGGRDSVSRSGPAGRSVDRLGLSRALQVDRNWLYAGIRDGTMAAPRHRVLGYYLIPDSPTLLQALRERRLAHRRSS